MLSLENSYNEEDLLDWDRKARELTGLEELEYCIEPKFDGASISLIYENDRLLRGVTRGDGVAGDEITTNIRQIRSVPLVGGLFPLWHPADRDPRRGADEQEQLLKNTMISWRSRVFRRLPIPGMRQPGRCG
jgi:hypothetical protein